MLARPPEQVHQAGPPAETPAPRTGDTALPAERTPTAQQTPATDRSPFDAGPRREEAPTAERTPFDPAQDTATPVRDETSTSERSPFDPAEDTAAPRREEPSATERSPFDPAEDTATPARDETPTTERSPFDPPQDTATPVREETPTSERSPFDPAEDTAAPRREEAPATERSPFDEAPPRTDDAPAAERSQSDPAEDKPTPPRDEAPATDQSPPHQDSAPQPERAADNAAPRSDRPVVDEPYIADPNFRTYDRADFDALGEAQLATGIVDERTGRLTHEHEFLEALAMRDLDAALRHMSDQGAYAVHSYTSSAVFDQINEALRTGRSLDEVMPMVRALASGLNEMPTYQGETVRRVNVRGEAAAIVAGRYEPGAVVVESQFLSSSRADLGSAKWPGDVEMIIEGKTGRYIESLASNKAEHEVLYKPGTQLVVKEKIEVETPSGGKKWVIRLEEITPDDPRYLPPDAAKQQMDRNRDLADVQEAEIAAASRRDFARAFGGEAAVADLPPKSEPETGPGTETPKPRKIGEPVNGWGDIRRSSDVVGEPAIHARSTDPVDPTVQSTGPSVPTRNAHQEVRFLREHLPEIADVNTRGYYADGMPEAYRNNSAESVLAFEMRMDGLQVDAQPGKLDDPRGRDFLSRQLGGEFHQVPDYNSAVREMAGQPVGSRAVLSVDTPDGQRAFSVVNTEHGVALVDPMTNRLADLPPNPSGVHLMQTHTGDGTPLANRSEPTPAAQPEPSVNRISELLGGGPERSEPVWNSADSNALRNRLDGEMPQPAGWNPFRRSEQPPATHVHQQQPPHQGGPMHQGPPVQHGWPQQQGPVPHNPYQQPAPPPNQGPPVQHGQYQQGAPHQQPPVHNPYQQPAPPHPNQGPPVQHGWPQQQGPVPHNPYQQPAPTHPNQGPPVQHGWPQQQAPVPHNPYQQPAPPHPNQGPPVQHGWPQQQAPVPHNPYQQPAPTHPNQGPPVQHGQYQQGAPHQQPPVHNPYQQSAPPQQHGWHQQQGPFQQHPGPLAHQGVPLVQNQPAPWSNMAGTTPGLHNLPAIHAGTTGPHEGAYVAARHPELPNVNPNRNVPNAVDKGYWHNCTRCVVAYAQRLVGIDS
ncbi:toxin glutamine deamidase domain-containing protein [Amycolatopsis thermoflava]|uniref:toxin glutamine deamidase domain-containing protein n=1 Tax=Amycolatopsis thermoflava TaxID=84480 RepID=UPI003EBC6B47